MNGWYYAKRGGPGGQPTGQPTGPLDWEQFRALAQAGALAPDDVVWHEAYPDWLPAARVPGLFPAVVPTSAAYSSGRRHSSLYWAVPLVVLVLAGAGLGVYFGFLRDGEDTSPTAHSGTTTATDGSGTEIAAASGVRLNCPEGWSSQTDGEGGLIVAEHQDDLTAEHPAGARLVLEAIGAASSDMTSALAEVLPSGTDPAAVAAGFSVVEDPATTQAGAEAAVSITFRDESTGPPMVTRYVVVELDGGGVFLFTLEAPADQWDDKRGQLETMVQSASFPIPAS